MRRCTGGGGQHVPDEFQIDLREVVGSGNDVSKDPAFTEAVAHKVYYGPVLSVSFDHLVGKREQVGRQFEADRFCGL